MAVKQPGRRDPTTVGDRLISALMGGFCGFGTALIIWLIVLYLGGRHGQDEPLAFEWTWMAGSLAAITGFFAGPERLMDVFERVWRTLGRIHFRFWPWLR